MTVGADLPHIDEHSIEIAAPPDRVWPALRGITGASSPPALAFGRAVGVRYLDATGDPLTEGATVLGFRVARAVPGSELALEGSHRFSNYALIFRIDPVGSRRSRLRAETRAAFPGAVGEAYKTMVIRTRFHVVAVKRMLRAAKRRAERG